MAMCNVYPKRSSIRARTHRRAAVACQDAGPVERLNTSRRKLLSRAAYPKPHTTPRSFSTRCQWRGPFVTGADKRAADEIRHRLGAEWWNRHKRRPRAIVSWLVIGPISCATTFCSFFTLRRHSSVHGRCQQGYGDSMDTFVSGFVSCENFCSVWREVKRGNASSRHKYQYSAVGSVGIESREESCLNGSYRQNKSLFYSNDFVLYSAPALVRQQTMPYSLRN